jgi:hypothetical protein
MDSKRDLIGDEERNRDDAHAGSRETGGVENDEMPDQGSTTGTTPSEEFVGRVSGQDVGYAEETGAERRAKVDGNSVDGNSVKGDSVDGKDEE